MLDSEEMNSRSGGGAPREGGLRERGAGSSRTDAEPKDLPGSVYESLYFGARLDGSMSLVRKYLCAFVFLDLVVHLLMYVVYLKHVQDYSLASLLGHQMSCYDIRTSFVDIALLSVGRFLLLEYLYGGVRSRSWTGTTLTTALTSVFVIVKSLHYDWANECRRAWLAGLIMLSFVSAWAEAFLVDFRLIGMEDVAEKYAGGNAPEKSSGTSELLVRRTIFRVSDEPETSKREIPRPGFCSEFLPMTVALFRRI